MGRRSICWRTSWSEPEPQHLLLVGAYRDNEVDAPHPLMRKLSAIRESGAHACRTSCSAPLGRDDLCRLVADALHCDAERTAPAGAAGAREDRPAIPSSRINSCRSLSRKLIDFDHGAARWRWDLAPIHAKGYTDNVVDLMVGKLSRLPATPRRLEELACLGNSAEPPYWRWFTGLGGAAPLRSLGSAPSELIVRSEVLYRFVHDRVQEAAYSLIPEAERADLHLRIGRFWPHTRHPKSARKRFSRLSTN